MDILLRERPWTGWFIPSAELNAFLNGMAGALLLAAFAAIKAGKRGLHGGLMLGALATSAVFFGLLSDLPHLPQTRCGHLVWLSGARCSRRGDLQLPCHSSNPYRPCHWSDSHGALCRVAGLAWWTFPD